MANAAERVSGTQKWLRTLQCSGRPRPLTWPIRCGPCSQALEQRMDLAMGLLGTLKQGRHWQPWAPQPEGSGPAGTSGRLG